MEVLVSQNQTFQIDSLAGIQELLCNLKVSSISAKVMGSNVVINALGQSLPYSNIHIVFKGGDPNTPALDQIIAMLLSER